MSFSFGFAVDDEQESGAAPQAGGASSEPRAPRTEQRAFQQVELTALRAALPGRISFSPLEVPLDELNGKARSLTLPRRDLFDVRFQLLNEDVEAGDDDTALTNAVRTDTLSDLVPGVYEGGLKTWECAADLVAELETRVRFHAGAGSDWPRGTHIAELGCGTAVPSVYMLQTVLAQPEPATQDTRLSLCDYNKHVLSLVVYPNMLLAWYFSAAGPGAQHKQPQQQPLEPGVLEIDEALLDAFERSLARHRITLQFFQGSWDSLHLGEVPADVLLTSETVYAVDSLPYLRSALQTARGSGKLTREDTDAIALVAAKVLYFGVGGGLDAFRAEVGSSGGWSEVVRSHAAGVGRAVLQVGWA